MPRKAIMKCKYMPCEYKYEKDTRAKKAGETCNVLTRVLRDGKYICYEHSPKRLSKVAEFFRKRGAEYMIKMDKRKKLLAQKYGIEDPYLVVGEHKPQSS